MPQHQRWLEPKFSEEHPFWSDGGWSSIFSKHSFRQVAVVLFILFFKTSWWKTASAVRNGRNSVPQTEVTTFAFSNVFIFPGLGIRLKTSYSTVDKKRQKDKSDRANLKKIQIMSFTQNQFRISRESNLSKIFGTRYNTAYTNRISLGSE